jgi:uncharacterized membrane protein YhaH (DUF805 family)
VTFTEAIQAGINNYTNFSGRAIRSEYWYWVLFAVLCSIVASLLDQMFLGGLAAIIVGLGLLLPGIAVAIRRMHDIGKSGWNILWGLIPLLGLIYLIYLYVQPGDPGSNAYGPPSSAAPLAPA